MAKEWYNVYAKEKGCNETLICRIKSKGLLYILKQELEKIYPADRFELIVK